MPLTNVETTPLVEVAEAELRYQGNDVVCALLERRVGGEAFVDWDWGRTSFLKKQKIHSQDKMPSQFCSVRIATLWPTLLRMKALFTWWTTVLTVPQEFHVNPWGGMRTRSSGATKCTTGEALLVLLSTEVAFWGRQPIVCMKSW